jgi:F-type H+-transporting ATPase subunit alpha
VEVLKQPQYHPLPVEKQVLILFAVTNAYLDDLEIEQCRKFEEELYRFTENAHPALLQTIREKKSIDDATRDQMHAVLKDFKQRFVSERRS